MWKLTISIERLGVLLFRKNNKVNKKSQFYIDKKPVSNVSEFTYLGINITANDNFTPTLTNLSSKGMTAIFASNSKFKLNRLPPNAAFKLFDSTIMLKLTYGSEVWGIFMNMDYSKCDKCAIEKTQLHFCKHILGVNEVPLLAILTRNISSKFFLLVFVNM